MNGRDMMPARLEPVGVSEGETVEYLECTGCGGIVQRGQFPILPSGRRSVLRYCPNCGRRIDDD